MKRMNLDTSLISDFTTAAGSLIGLGGGIWASMGIVSLGGALKEQNGNEIKASIWHICGAAIITAGGVYLATLG